MDLSRLDPILNKESILKTANAAELDAAPQDVLERYTTYGLTHIPLGDTTRQLANLKRVITVNKLCAVGSIVGPYGYGKTSTAVHLWNELRQTDILAVPPFQWNDLAQLMGGVYHWVRFEFSQGRKDFLPALDDLYKRYQDNYLAQLSSQYDAKTIQELADQGLLRLNIQATDVVQFYAQTCDLCLKAGFAGLAIFTDELQATVAAYQPSRDAFYADLFQIVKDTLGLPGQWALIMTMDDNTEALLARDRADMLQRIQSSALYFRVKDVYNRREYPAELWAAFAERFGFDGSAVIHPDTLESIGQVAARSDLGAGPRMVTHALSLAIRHFSKTNTGYEPVQFVDDFLNGQVLFDQRGKFSASVKKALNNGEVRSSPDHQKVVKFIAAYPMGCTDALLERFQLTGAFSSFPPLARRELIVQQAGGFILRYMAEEEIEPEQIEQRLIKEFVSRFTPNRFYAVKAAEGFLRQVLLDPSFRDWKLQQQLEKIIDGNKYSLAILQGTFDARSYPDRSIALTVAALPTSTTPHWHKAHPDVDLEYRFELNFGSIGTEPNRLLVKDEPAEIAIFQLNMGKVDTETAKRILPEYLFEYYKPEQLTPLLCLALIEHLDRNAGDLPDDRNRINTVINPLRQYVLQVLLGDQIEFANENFASKAIGTQLLSDLFRQMCRHLYPNYVTLIKTRKWQEGLQQYNYALQSVEVDDGLSVIRGRRQWNTTKDKAADSFRIPGRRLTNLEPLLDSLDDLIEKVEFSGRATDSPIVLQFLLHPLEKDWLERLDASQETVTRDGIRVSAIPSEDLLRSGTKGGYRPSELQEVLRLMRTRRYVDWDPKRNMLVRTVDAVDDLKESVIAQLDEFDEKIRQLSTALPDFEGGRYPIARWRATLEQAQERDQIETIRADIREKTSSLNAHVAGRSSQLRTKLEQELQGVHDAIRSGVPTWLGNPLPNGPFAAILESQRTSLASSYQVTLDELRSIREDVQRDAQGASGESVHAVIALYNCLRKLTDESEKLKRRLNSNSDRQSDIEKWRKVITDAQQVDQVARQAFATYGNAEFAAKAEKLWKVQEKELEQNPLAVLDMHSKVHRPLASLWNEIKAWLDGRREDFEHRCTVYGDALSKAGVKGIELRIPFDSQRPTDSYDALSRRVQQAVAQQIEDTSKRLQRHLQAIRYGIQVQNLSLNDVETATSSAISEVAGLEESLVKAQIDDFDSFYRLVLEPLSTLLLHEADLGGRVQSALQRRGPEGSEIELMQTLSQYATARDVDLRGLILQLLDRGERSIDLDRLMRDLQSLFQKNQIGIQIHMLADQVAHQERTVR